MEERAINNKLAHEPRTYTLNTMRKRRCWLFVVMSFILCASQFFTAAPALAKDDVQLLSISINTDEPSTIDRLYYHIFKELGYEVTTEASGMASAIMKANSGEMAGLATQTAGIEKDYPNLIMVPEPIASVSFCCYALTGKNYHLDSWDDFNGLRVGYLFQKVYIDAHLPEGVAQRINKASLDELYTALETGECDVVVVSSSSRQRTILRENLSEVGEVDSLLSYAYLNKKYAALVEPMAQVLRNMKENGTYEKILNQQKLSEDQKTVLHISSYYPDMDWDSRLTEGLQSTLQANGEEIVIYSAYLNSNRLLNDRSRSNSITNLIRTSFMHDRPDVVIASDDNALDFVLDNYSILFQRLPVVFCGINGYSEKDIRRLSEYATGTLETLPVKDLIEAMLKLYPQTKNVYVINDHYESGRAWQRQMAWSLRPYESRLNVSYNDDLPLNELYDAIRALPPDTLILTGMYCVDKNGAYYPVAEVQAGIAQNANAPVFGMMDTTIGYGQVGGKYVDAFRQGALAAQMALNIMDGAEVQDIPALTDTSASTYWAFDNNVIKENHIAISTLPKEATIINRPLTMKETNPTEFALIMTILAIVILGLIALVVFSGALRKKNRTLIETQKSLHTAEELLVKEEEVKAVKERLERTLEGAPLLYLLSVQNKVVETNAYSRDQLHAAVGDETGRFFADQNEHDRLYASMENESMVFGQVTELRMGGGEVHRFQLNLITVDFENQRAILLLGADVEELQMQRDRLARAEQDLRRAVEALPTPMQVYDPVADKVLFASLEFCKLFEIASFDEMENTRVYDFLQGEQSDGRPEDAIVEFLQNARLSPKATSIEWEFVVNGRRIYTIVTASGIVFSQKDCLVLHIKDITAEREKEDALMRAAAREKEANQLKSRFLVNMSHEIRTPMNAIIGFSQLALNNKDQLPEPLEVFRKIHLSAQNLLSIINDILDFSKIEAQKLDLIEAEFNLEEVIANAIMVASQHIDNKQIEMLLDLRADVPYYLIGDKTRVWQILKNTLDNAVKYTEAGRVLVRVELLEDESNDETVMICFTIQDTGMGMSDDQLSRLFVPFEQFHNGVRNNVSGTGLGMSIIHQLLELMGGSIEVSSKERVGTTERICIPFKRSEKDDTLRSSTRTTDMGNTSVLIADDDECACQIMQNLVRMLSLEPVTVHSGADAVQLATERTRKGVPFKLIILDYMLGEENGIEVAREMRAAGVAPSRFLMVSAYARQLIATEVESVGINAVIEKPFMPSTFLNTVSSCMDIPVSTLVEPEYGTFPDARVLLVEDNLLNQEVAKGTLEGFGIFASVVANGQECLELLDREEFDLVFMDIKMPVMDGITATERIRGSRWPYKKVPIVAMTANVVKEEVEKCMIAGMDGYTAKPLDLDDIYGHLCRYLSKYYQKAEKPSKDIPLHIDGFDIEGGVARFAGNKEAYFGALAKFADKVEEMVPPPESGLLAENEQETMRRLHKMKGAAGNLGADGLYESIARFEAKHREGEIDFTMYADIQKQAKALSLSVQSALPNQGA